MQKQSIKPERTDNFFLKEVLQMAFNARIGMILMTVVVLFLVAVIFFMLSRPTQTIVIDRGTGQTYAPVGLQQGVTQELLNRQLVFYTGQVIENYFNFTHTTIIDMRRSVYELTNTQFREKLGKAFIGEDEAVRDPDLKRCMDEKMVSYLQWEIHPRITQRNDPYYTTFATFQRVIKSGNVTKEIKKFNVRVDWGRLNDNMDYTRRPHSLVLLDIKILNEGSIELNEQINRLGQ